MSATLTIKHGSIPGQTYQITSALNVGSEAQNDIVIPETPPKLFEIRPNEQESYLITSLSQPYSILINGESLERQRTLVDGDEIAVPPEIIFTFRIQDRSNSSQEALTAAPAKQKNKILPIIVGLILASGGLGLLMNGLNRNLPVAIIIGLLMLGLGIRQLYIGMN